MEGVFPLALGHQLSGTGAKHSSSWVRRVSATAQAVLFCTLMSPGAMNFSLLEQNTAMPAKYEAKFHSVHSPHTTRENCRWREEKPKVPAFQGNQSLTFLELLIHEIYHTSPRPRVLMQLFVADLRAPSGSGFSIATFRFFPHFLQLFHLLIHLDITAWNYSGWKTPPRSPSPTFDHNTHQVPHLLIV